MPDPVLHLSRFSRRFHGPGSPPVLDALDLIVPAGEFVALLGRSGSGKTTLLRTLAGLDPVTDGKAVLPERRAVVFQEPRLLPWKPVWRNVALGLPGPSAAARDRALAALAEVELSHRAEAWPLTLSGGEAQRAGLARALVREPDLLLLDEPFASLDALTRLRMQSLVGELWQAHRPAVLLVTHDVEEALLLADRVLVLAEGRLAEDLAVGVPRPRRRAAPGFDALRLRLLATLGVDEDGHDATARAA
ncbi:ABC transporter ATP-binding protein [Paracraurococcus ruber]|uniref:Sulfonate ABC transporter ATP-binding protein n=1 Tax=Paracraurococcus ruber TaxID=77675 RepID=A0ABS1CQF1_9PROT|nr:ABC transporter ATP-binding protein [Paracraurococcus ruber]MBK1656650.1 sulfonate ABC transporter ATP-binding protein [Paracraurococcus ruber]TDG33727.1 ABC transporter ATP-binding protein [Paracraurococcus ruber]